MTTLGRIIALFFCLYDVPVFIAMLYGVIGKKMAKKDRLFQISLVKS